MGPPLLRQYRDSLIPQVCLISHQRGGDIRLWITPVATTWQQRYLWVCYIDKRTGEGQWVDLACIEAAGTLNGVATLDATVNQRPMRRSGMPNSNRSQSPQMAPHGIWQTRGEDEWVAIAVRNDDDWKAMSEVIGEPWSTEKRWEQIEVRLRDESELEQRLAEWAITHNRREIAERLVDAGVPAARFSSHKNESSLTRELSIYGSPLITPK